MTKQEIMKVIAADRTLKQAYNTEPLFTEQIDYLGAREPISATDLLKCIKHMCTGHSKRYTCCQRVCQWRDMNNYQNLERN